MTLFVVVAEIDIRSRRAWTSHMSCSQGTSRYFCSVFRMQTEHIIRKSPCQRSTSVDFRDDISPSPARRDRHQEALRATAACNCFSQGFLQTSKLSRRKAAVRERTEKSNRQVIPKVLGLPTRERGSKLIWLKLSWLDRDLRRVVGVTFLAGWKDFNLLSSFGKQCMSRPAYSTS